MPDTYGNVQVPVALPPAAGVKLGDTALSLIVAYCGQILNTYGQTAWSSVAPSTQMATRLITSPVITSTHGHDPGEEEFVETELPALYLWRHEGGEPPYWLAEDIRIAKDTWTMLLVARPAKQPERKLRQSFCNAVVKLLDIAIETQRDPSYVASWDTDPTARTTPPAPAALKLAVASSTNPQTYSGAALNGAIGTTTFAPAQNPTVTVTGAACSGEVVFSGVGADGAPRTSRVELTGLGTFTADWTLQSVTSVAIPGQANTAATITLGLAGFVGLGTNVFVLGNFFSIGRTRWVQRIWTLKMNDMSPVRSYDAIEFTFEVVERWNRDISTAPDDEADAQFPRSGADNSDLLGEALYS